MYNNINRDSEYICNLRNFIQRTYQIIPVSLISAKRGYYGETWRLDTGDSSYFIKLVYASTYMDIYERSFPIIQHICDHGIEFISRIVKTKTGDLSARFDGAVLGVFDWIDGEHIETNATKIPEYQMLTRVYTVPVHGISIIREDFSGGSADKFFKQWSALNDTNPTLKHLMQYFINPTPACNRNNNVIRHISDNFKEFINDIL